MGPHEEPVLDNMHVCTAEDQQHRNAALAEHFRRNGYGVGWIDGVSFWLNGTWWHFAYVPHQPDDVTRAFKEQCPLHAQWEFCNNAMSCRGRFLVQ